MEKRTLCFSMFSFHKRKSKLAPFKPLINEWLDSDVMMPRKQRHTAQRIYSE